MEENFKKEDMLFYGFMFLFTVSVIGAFYFTLSYFNPRHVCTHVSSGTPCHRDIVALSCIINAEADTKDMQDMYLVGSTVLNRVDEEGFPLSIYEVISAPGQFKGFNSKQYFRTPKSDYVALDLLEGRGRDYCVLYFFNDAKSTDRTFVSVAKSNFTFVDSTSAHLYYGR